MAAATSGFARFEYEVAPEAGLAYARVEGAVTGRDMLAVLEAVHADARWADGFDFICDCTGVRGHEVSPPDTRPVVLEAARGGSGADVIVMSPADDDGHLAEMPSVYSRRLGKRVVACATVDEGLAALGRGALPAPLARGQGAGR